MANPNLDITELGIYGTANLLGEPQQMKSGSYRTGTDGLLLCAVQGFSSTAGLCIGVTPFGESTDDYYITTDDSTEYGTNILIPVAKEALVSLQEDSGSTYYATWHPFGTSPGFSNT
ncbi:hypothetical protein ACWY4P_48750 [Streptomyces sp. LZ34]